MEEQYDPVDVMDALHGVAGWRYAYDPAITDLAELKRWQGKARGALSRCLKSDLLRAVPLQPQLERTWQREGYLQQRFVLQTSAGTQMPVYLMTPDDLAEGERRPVVIALNGHGLGAKLICGLTSAGKPRGALPARAMDAYQKDFAVELVKRGFVVAVPELIGFGDRRHVGDLRKKRPWSCDRVAPYAQMLGTSLLGIRVHEVMRMTDWLQESVVPADVGRLGVMGISGGGMLSLFFSALERRVQASVVSGYLCPWRSSILGLYHCSCNFAPEVYRLMDAPDVAALVAPRPLLVEAATEDELFPHAAVKRAVSHARRAWRAAGVPRAFQTDYFEGKHEISGSKAYTFLSASLRA